MPSRLDVEVNGFNGGVLNGVPSAYHWYTEQYGVKWPVGYEVNISSQRDNFIQVDFDTPWCQPESDVIAELSRRFSCTLEHWYAEQGCDFCGRARDGRFYRSRLALVTVYASPSPFSDERPSSRFRGISSPSKRRRLRYSTVGLTRYRTR